MTETGFCISQPCVTVTKHLKDTIYRKGRFALAHSFLGFSQWSVGSLAGELGEAQDPGGECRVHTDRKGPGSLCSLECVHTRV